MKLKHRAVPIIALMMLSGTVWAEEKPDQFLAGDIVLRTGSDLRWYRGDKQIGNWGQSLPIAGDRKQQVWAGFVQDNKITLRKFTSPTKSQDYSSDATFEGGTIAKLIPAGDQMYILLTAPHNGKDLERTIKLVPFSILSGTFGEEIVLKDYNGQPELLILPPIPAPDQLPKPRRELLTHGIWDAVLFGKNQLWISSQDQILSYLVAEVPAGSDQGAGHVEGNGTRKKVIHRRDTDVGNPRGIAPYSDTQLAMVDCAGSGRVVLLGALGAASNLPLTAQIDPEVAFTWGWSGIVVSKDDIFVSNSNPAAARVTRIDRRTGQVKGNLVSGFPVTEIVEIQ